VSKGSMGTMKMAPKDTPKTKNLMGNSNDDKFTIRIMSYNIWGGGANEQKQVNETVAVILAAKADIIGVQETRLESDPCTAESCPAVGNSVAGTIADSLGFYFYDQTAANAALWANAVISRYPIVQATKHDLGVMINVNNSTIYAYNLHLTDFPYQPCKYNVHYLLFLILKHSHGAF
jgi:exodeoxyribonuclease III